MVRCFSMTNAVSLDIFEIFKIFKQYTHKTKMLLNWNCVLWVVVLCAQHSLPTTKSICVCVFRFFVVSDSGLWGFHAVLGVLFSWIFYPVQCNSFRLNWFFYYFFSTRLVHFLFHRLGLPLYDALYSVVNKIDHYTCGFDQVNSNVGW